MPNANKTLAGGGFHHVAIRAADFGRSYKFYVDGLGFTEKMAWGKAPRRAVMLDTGDGNYLEIFERPELPAPVQAEGAAIMHFAIRTEDCDAAATRAVAAGGVITMEPKDVPIDSSIGEVVVRIAFFKGPDGEVVELFQNDQL